MTMTAYVADIREKSPQKQLCQTCQTFSLRGPVKNTSDKSDRWHFDPFYGGYPGEIVSDEMSDKSLTVRRGCGKINRTAQVLLTPTPPLTDRQLEGAAMAISDHIPESVSPTTDEICAAIQKGVWDAFPYAELILQAIADGCREGVIALAERESRSRRSDRRVNKRVGNPPIQQRAKAVIPPDLRWTVWERDDFTCRHCGARTNLSIDHILAESKGGPATLENFQTLCRSCNSRKGSR